MALRGGEGGGRPAVRFLTSGRELVTHCLRWQLHLLSCNSLLTQVLGSCGREKRGNLAGGQSQRREGKAGERQRGKGAREEEVEERMEMKESGAVGVITCSQLRD